MRGENASEPERFRGPQGLSPHARGKRVIQVLLQRFKGTIPACAGKTIGHISPVLEVRDYPRMRGENSETAAESQSSRGLSPHARGKHAGAKLCPLITGTIPACAGKTFSALTCGVFPKDYPRMRGENALTNVNQDADVGLSPHARGKQRRRRACRSRSGTIPACAGKTSNLWTKAKAAADYPRMRGENFSKGCVMSVFQGLSPHARGKHFDASELHILLGTIPACAGKTLDRKPLIQKEISRFVSCF